jgi:hypothetical protein
MITGATGFLGMHVLYDLVSKGYRVKALFRDQDKIASVKKVFRYYRNDVSAIWDQIEWIHGDLLDFYNLMECLNGVTEVYHTAGKVSFSRRDKENLFRVNIQGTANLVDACLELDIEKFCHVSSIATLSEPDGAEPVGEDLIWNPGGSASVYAISKLRGEMEVWRGIRGRCVIRLLMAEVMARGIFHKAKGEVLSEFGWLRWRDVASACEGNRGAVVNAEKPSSFDQFGCHAKTPAGDHNVFKNRCSLFTFPANRATKTPQNSSVFIKDRCHLKRTICCGFVIFVAFPGEVASPNRNINILTEIFIFIPKGFFG